MVNPRDRKDILEARSRGLFALRNYFTGEGFVEIEPPHLLLAPGMEPHLRPFQVGEKHWLSTSPEFHLKRLLAEGFEKLVSICRCFRNEEAGPHHSPEFTMVEWYRAGVGTQQLMDDVVSIAQQLADELPSTQELRATVQGEWETMTVSQAMQRFAGFSVRGDESPLELKELAVGAGVDLGTAKEWDDIFYCVFLEKVEPALTRIARPVFVTEWPLPLSALAKQLPGRPVVERFELYANGLELANAFGELTCAKEQRRRFEVDAARIESLGLPERPIDEKFLAAMSAGMPESSGIALGFDRLLMWLLGRNDIGDVQAFPSSAI